MGRRDSEITPDEASLQTAEAETRRLLERYGEPQVAPAPEHLNARVVQALPAARLPERGSRLRDIYTTIVAVGLVLLFSLGVWGVLVDSSGPASLFGDLASGFGQFLLTLTLLAKPMVNLLLNAGAYTLVSFMAIFGGGWLWWKLVQVDMGRHVEATV